MINLTRNLHLAESVDVPAEFFQSRFKIRKSYTHSDIVKTKGIKVTERKNGNLRITYLSGPQKIALVMPTSPLPTGHFTSVLRLKPEKNVKSKITVAAFNTDEAIFPTDKLVFTSQKKLFKKFVKYNAKNNATIIDNDICSSQWIPKFPCIIQRINYFKSLSTSSFQSSHLRFFANNHKYYYVVYIFDLKKSSYEITYPMVFESRGTPERLINKKLPNLVTYGIYNNSLGYLESNIGIKTPTDSKIKFEIKLPKSNENILSLKVGYHNHSYLDPYIDSSVKSNPVSFEIKITCRGFSKFFFNKTYSSEYVGNRNRFLTEIYHPIYKECSGKKTSIEFITKKQGQARSVLFLANPTVINREYSKKPPNLIVITADALRMDHTSLHGYFRDTTPRLKQFAKLGASFNHYYTQKSLTRESFPVMFSGKYAYKLKPYFSIGPAFFPIEVRENLPLILSKAGYQNFAVVGAEEWGKGSNGLEFFNATSFPKSISFTETNHVVQKWMKGLDEKRPYFLWLHVNKPHGPYQPAPKYRKYRKTKDFEMGYFMLQHNEFLKNLKNVTQDTIDQITAIYDEFILDMDDHIARQLLEIDNMKKLDNTLLVITSDHGENMTEQDVYFQHATIEKASLHVPLVMVYPPKIPANTIVNQNFESVDLTPTILDILGLKSNIPMDGRSALPVMTKKKNLGRKYTFADFQEKIFTIQSDKWKYVYNPENFSFRGTNFPRTYTREKEGLYRIDIDPSESNNIISKHAVVAKLLKHKLSEIYINKIDVSRSIKPKLSPELIRLLERTGYLNWIEDE